MLSVHRLVELLVLYNMGEVTFVPGCDSEVFVGGLGRSEEEV